MQYFNEDPFFHLTYWKKDNEETLFLREKVSTWDAMFVLSYVTINCSVMGSVNSLLLLKTRARNSYFKRLAVDAINTNNHDEIARAVWWKSYFQKRFGEILRVDTVWLFPVRLCCTIKESTPEMLVVCENPMINWTDRMRFCQHLERILPTSNQIKILYIWSFE